MHTYNTLRICTLVALLSLPGLSSRAELRGPYAPDTNTLHLYHMDEAAVPVVDFTLSGGTNLASLAAGATLNNASALGFNTALSTVDGGINGIYNTNRDAVLSGRVLANSTADNVAITLAGPGNAFTYEAIIRMDFDPAVNVAAPPTGNGRAGGMMIVAGEDEANAGRIFQWRLLPIGGGANQFSMEFINVNRAVSVQNIVVPIPTTGPNAPVSNGWFHVAVAYSGQPGVEDNLRFYWTRLDASRVVANLIGRATMNLNLPTLPVTDFAIGNIGRNSALMANFVGLVDEVRLSGIQRGAMDMLFFTNNLVITEQPAGQTMDYGASTRFRAEAASLNPLTYQWRQNGAEISGATSNVYNIAFVDAAAVGSYDVVIADGINTQTSSVAVLTLAPAGTTLAHRYSFNTDANDSVGTAHGTLMGAANLAGGGLVLDGFAGNYLELPGGLLNGQSKVSFEFWGTFGTSLNNARVFDFGNSDGTTGQNYLYFAARTGANAHRVDLNGQMLEAAGALDGRTVHVAVVVDPPNRRMQIYTNGVLEVSRTGVSNPLTVVSNIYSFVGRSMFAADAHLNATIDEFRIYNGDLSATSVRQSYLQGTGSPLTDGPVVVVTAPTNATVAQGQSVTFNAVIGGRQPIAYQWYKNSAPISGATNNSVTFTALVADDNATIELRATNVVGVTTHTISTSAILDVVVPPILVWLGANGSDWDLAALNWSNTALASVVAFGTFDGALFDDRGSSAPTVNLTQQLTPSSVTVNSSSDYTLTSFLQNGGIGGQSGLTKQGSGTLILDTTNTYAGATIIQGGRLQLGNSGNTGTLGSGPVTNNATLAFQRWDDFSVPNLITGSGSITQSGGGILRLSGTNLYGGPTVVAAGAIAPGNPDAFGSPAVGVTVLEFAQLFIDSNIDLANEPILLYGQGPGTGSLRKGGAGASSLGSLITLGSDALIKVDGNSTLRLTNAAGISSAGAGLTLAADTGGTGISFGPLSLGSGFLTKDGPGAWQLLSTANTFTGGILINAGTLQLGNGLVDGSLPPGIVTNNGTLAFFGTNNQTISYEITGTGGVNQLGSNTTTLATANTYTGATAVNGGTLLVVNNDSLGTTNGNTGVTGNFGATSRVAFSGNVTVAEAFSLAARQPLPDIGGDAAHLINLSGTNTLTGAITVVTGGNQYNIESAAGLLICAGNYSQASGTGDRFLNLQGAGNALWTGEIQDGLARVNVTKRGTGSWTLAGSNSYSGPTIVSNGTLVVTGSIFTNTVTVQANGTLGGTGSILGAVVVQGLGTLAPGPNAIGTLSISNSLVMQSGSTNRFEVNAALGTKDEVVGLTGVTYGGTLVVNNLAGSLTTASAFQLFSAGAYTGAFAAIVPATPGAGLAWNTSTLTTDGTLRVTTGLPSTPTNITAVVVGGNTLDISWPADYTGWKLQSQTNTVSVGLSAGWTDVPGSTDTNRVIMSIDPTRGAVFFRMVLP